MSERIVTDMLPNHFLNVQSFDDFYFHLLSFILFEFLKTNCLKKKKLSHLKEIKPSFKNLLALNKYIRIKDIREIFLMALNILFCKIKILPQVNVS